jgi:protein-L-isoaspartate O-methyltransferase
MSLADAWEANSGEWITWARAPGHDGFWTGTWPQLRAVLPEPAGLTVEIGCGEGRATRNLMELGHTVVAVERSGTLAAAAHGGSPPVTVERRTVDREQRDGLSMTFVSDHRPLSAYVAALADAGLAVTAMREWGARVIPWLLVCRAVKLPTAAR